MDANEERLRAMWALDMLRANGLFGSSASDVFLKIVLQPTPAVQTAAKKADEVPDPAKPTVVLCKPRELDAAKRILEEGNSIAQPPVVSTIEEKVAELERRLVIAEQDIDTMTRLQNHAMHPLVGLG